MKKVVGTVTEKFILEGRVTQISTALEIRHFYFSNVNVSVKLGLKQCIF